MRYDDPWLRAVIVAPPLVGAMIATPFGEPDLAGLRALMSKPAAAVVTTFASDPYPGIKPNCFSGNAIVQLTT